MVVSFQDPQSVEAENANNASILIIDTGKHEQAPNP